jgi:hypothetical protein
LINKIKKLKLTITLSLKLFLNSNDINLYYNEALNNNNYSPTMLNFFQKKMRYKLSNSKDSSGHYTGYWTKKTTKKSQFEKLYDILKYVPLYTIDFYNFIHKNPEIDKIKQNLDNIYDTEDDSLVSI